MVDWLLLVVSDAERTGGAYWLPGYCWWSLMLRGQVELVG